MTPRSETIYESAGGAEAFRRLAEAHHQRCLDDPVLEHPFSHPGHPEHVQRLADYWAEVLGGPPRYSQESDGQSWMLGLHAGVEADDDFGDRFLACFLHAIDDAQLPEDPELRETLRAYMTWAVREVMSYSPRGSEVAEGLVMPRWSWDGPEARAS
jgi:hemoglobin